MGNVRVDTVINNIGSGRSLCYLIKFPCYKEGLSSSKLYRAFTNFHRLNKAIWKSEGKHKEPWMSIKWLQVKGISFRYYIISQGKCT